METTAIKELYDACLNASGAEFHDRRWAFLDAVAKAGVDATLIALDFPRTRDAIWYNVNTGSEETLESLLHPSYGRTPSLEDEPHVLGFALENWLPKTESPNPIIARSLAISESGAANAVILHLKSDIDAAPSEDAFVVNVADRGASMDDGMYVTSPKGKGTVHVSLHDGRDFTFSLRSLWRNNRRELNQPTLFAI